MKKKNLSTYSFLNNIKNTTTSVCFMIIENFFIIGLNALKITKVIKEKYNKLIQERHIEKVFRIYQKNNLCIMKNKNNTSLIVGFDNEGKQKIVAIDESLFVHDSNLPIWVIREIELIIEEFGNYFK